VLTVFDINPALSSSAPMGSALAPAGGVNLPSDLAPPGKYLQGYPIIGDLTGRRRSSIALWLGTVRIIVCAENVGSF
jgi:hypothetical protein